jgi:basic membrane protein A
LKRRLLRYLAFGLLACVSGCTSHGADSGGAHIPESRTTSAPPIQGKTVRAAIVLQTGGVDDRSFNAAAVSGLMRAKQELGLGEKGIKYIASQGPADFKPNLVTFANQDYDIVFAVGYQLVDALQEVAPQFPNIKFAIVDALAPDAPNCAGLVFREQEGAFLAGFLAASVSKTKRIGYVGGVQIPVTERVEAGYKAGARTANPSVTVTATYTGDWSDVGKGRSQAEQQFDAGADIILQGAGKSGLGVIEAAKERGTGYYAIGTDQDQDALAPGRVLTTLIKHTDYAVFDTIRSVKAGQFTPGTHVYGLKEGGIGLSDMRYTKQDVPPEVLAKLEKVKQEIVAGQIVPPTTLKELAAFQSPRL